jgi:ATP-binding cassette subfamily F protein uup
MESAILATEARAQELEATLNDPDFHATRSREAHGLITELEAAKLEIARLYDRWHDLSSRQA